MRVMLTDAFWHTCRLWMSTIIGTWKINKKSFLTLNNHYRQFQNDINLFLSLIYYLHTRTKKMKKTDCITCHYILVYLTLSELSLVISELKLWRNFLVNVALSILAQKHYFKVQNLCKLSNQLKKEAYGFVLNSILRWYWLMHSGILADCGCLQ